MNFCCMKCGNEFRALLILALHTEHAHFQVLQFAQGEYIDSDISVGICVLCKQYTEMKMWSTPTNKRKFLFIPSAITCVAAVTKRGAVECVAQLQYSLGRVKGKPTPNTR